jgi:hypothetical protein
VSRTPNVRLVVRLVASIAVIAGGCLVVSIALIWHYFNAFAAHLSCPERAGAAGELLVGGPSSGSWCRYPDGQDFVPEKSSAFTMARPLWSLIVLVLVAVATMALAAWSLRALSLAVQPGRLPRRSRCRYPTVGSEDGAPVEGAYGVVQGPAHDRRRDAHGMLSVPRDSLARTRSTS